ncbi:bifunctional diaminohydroxyphosphoribosylaminopyrimidine deaminase/5-amino-6-(5-phosphoribosylamino)uracil reductase RibD [Candidimonas humi]|uniref:Riboflavin biosynthesis protein RibD n=1 Tax=Candidimonas humi TaxID=683355 RepID=A0ABV8P076_9BURK|nr:bifunctional diaminohydroxyphosphoribosylaminopyrimidine deaminase/5-amino-6-(5-phosphoribosylamino)uracil reductase RibD [Candidimonas humi]MBV6305428.1 bifunctional diaminohydroxyphosphoribosylaminopyrimidine deaminase/5-amino-6-(5-phosphoribosylamino)uracil reductase RibD [Candidimonas humi]
MSAGPDNTAASDDAHWMRRALALAEGVLYLTAPNPRVGCVIVRDGQVLGEGATQAVGGPHAEIMALRDMQARGHAAAGATIYVTLEPCSHHGRTPPCVDALIAARPARVVVAMSDPNPLVGGQGLARLRAAGIPVTASVCAEEALALNPGFVARMTRRTPWLWLKLAASMDGRSALHNGASQWITGPAARADGHHWRARSCVVLTGSGTVRLDNPQMNVRHVQTPRQPIRAIVDTRLETSEDARILDGGPVWIFTCTEDAAKARRLEARNARVIPMPSAPSRPDAPNGSLRVDLAAMLRWMGEHDINEVHAEPGSKLSGALLQSGCVDELLLYMAPLLLGDAQPMARLPALQSLDQARRFEFFETVPLAPDLRIRARVAQNWRELLRCVRAPGDAGA